MSVALPVIQIQQEPPAPRLLVELPSRPRVFFGNLRDTLLPRRQPPLELHSAPAQFWPDVFVRRSLPWYSFLESGAYHVIAMPRDQSRDLRTCQVDKFRTEHDVVPQIVHAHAQSLE